MEESNEHRRENVSKYKWVIVSYDASRRRPSAAARVAEFVHGRKVRIRTKRGVKTYHYQGAAAKSSVEIVGQSVVMMRERDAEDFHRFLSELRVPHTRLEVWVDF